MAANPITGYHAHVYYDPAYRAPAAALREAVGDSFTVELGRWHDQPIGPHPRASYQIAFAAETFADIVPWLMRNRGGLTILVHPETGDDLADHSDHAMWLGDSLALDLNALR